MHSGSVGHTPSGQADASLADAARAPDAALPVTGVSLEAERALSAIHVCLPPHYGTRASTVVMAQARSTTLVERSFFPQQATQEVRRTINATQ